MTSHPGSSRSGTLFDLPGKQARRKELEAKMGDAGFWDNQETAKDIVSEMKMLKHPFRKGVKAQKGVEF